MQTDLEKRIAKVKTQVRGIRILGGADVSVQGSLKTGYAVNFKGKAADTTASEDVFGCTDPEATNFNPAATLDDGSCEYPGTGACCCTNDDGSIDCFDDETEEACITCCPVCVYQGDDTVCEPETCGGGACCFGTDCTIYADEGSCVAAEGEWQGDDTVCDPNPCSGACCDGEDCFETDETTCTDDGREFKGLGTSCDDENICPTGACCADFNCSVDSEFNCNAFSGTYQGDDTPCFPDPCPQGCCPGDGDDCTEVPPDDCTGTPLYGSGCEGNVCGCTDSEACNYDPSATVDDESCGYAPSADIACDIAYNSGSKCGFYVAGSPPHYYLTSQEDDVWSASATQGGGQFCHGDANARIDFYGSGALVASYITTWDIDTCVSTSGGCVPSGGSFTLTRSQTGTNATHCDDLYPGCSTYSFTEGCPDGTWDFVGGGARITTGSACGQFTVLGPSVSYSNSDEYTTSMLISHVEAGLPAFPGTYESGACCASRSLSSDESTYSEQIAQYKFEFGTSTSNFQVDWVERFTPAGGGGSSDTPMSDTFSMGTTESGIYSLGVPGSNGTTCIEDVVVTCI